MSVILNTYGFLYGIVAEKPALPDGWKYIEEQGHWLIAELPGGKQYFVSDKAILYRRAQHSGGGHYADLDDQIQL